MGIRGVIGLVVVLAAMAPFSAFADTVVVILTEILSPDPQAGVKSRHNIKFDFAAKKHESSFETGTTSFFGVALSSVRDNFQVKNVNFTDPSKVTFLAVGETASGVGIVPNINYELTFELSQNGDTKITGCHDGYPAYTVTVDQVEKYSFKHQSIQVLNLFGTCDIVVSKP